MWQLVEPQIESVRLEQRNLEGQPGQLTASGEYRLEDGLFALVAEGRNISLEEELLLIEFVIKECQKFIRNYVEGISKGKFNISKLKNRESKVCNYCSFRSVCRVQEAG